MSEAKRETLTARRPTREQLAQSDWQTLLHDEKFLRVLFTIMELAGMFTGNFQSDQRTHAYFEGRRSWGLDILRTAEKYLGPTALKCIVDAEMKTLQEAPSDRSRTGYAEHRNRELGGDDLDERSNENVRYLDYSDRN